MGKYDISKPITLEHYKMIFSNHISLCEFLHENCMDEIKSKILADDKFEELWEMVYLHFEP